MARPNYSPTRTIIRSDTLLSCLRRSGCTFVCAAYSVLSKDSSAVFILCLLCFLRGFLELWELFDSEGIDVFGVIL
jgi:hypothetical protein